MLILGVETSCDETAASVVDDRYNVRSSIVHSQIDIHRVYGGVVPELASRDHLMMILPVIKKALDTAGVALSDINGFAVTNGPGLIGSLLVGLQTAKTLAFVTKKPLVPVNHVEAHITACLLEPSENDIPEFPYIALAVSGGHTAIYTVYGIGSYKLLGETLDDAAGEAFDKAAKLLSLGYPGGVAIEQISAKGDKNAFRFPRAMLGRETLDFSFSGMKTAIRNVIESIGSPVDEHVSADLAASFQEAVTDVLLNKVLHASQDTGIRSIVISGGVAANRRLREKIRAECGERKIEFFLTPFKYCTDNAAMVAGLGMKYLLAFPGKYNDFLDLDASSNLAVISE
jgi:N6-L-threonylcarbamoyladenine synthase